MMNLLPQFLIAAKDSSCTSGKIFNVGLYDRLCDPKTHEVNITALTDIYVLLGNIIRILLGFVGMLSVIFIVVGGIMYILSTGEPARIAKAKTVVTNAVVGLIIALASYAVVTYIAGAF